MVLSPSLKRQLHVFLFFVSFTCTFVLVLRIPPASAHESGTENKVIIHVDGEGFKPSKTTITAGTEVVFENVDQEEHWPASDDHPSHTLYDSTSLEEHCSSNSTLSFDACRSIAGGKTWSFVFEKAGIYPYHDHLWPHLNGEIIVKETIDRIVENENVFSRFIHFLKRFFSSTFNSLISHQEEIVLHEGDTENEFYQELKIQFENLVLQSNPREAIAALQSQSLEDDRVPALCHDLLHLIGHTAYKKYRSFKASVKYQSDFCNSGYIHGLFESYFESVSDPFLELSELCSDYASGRRQFDSWQCHHGIGHGFMYHTGGDLDESLQLCGNRLEKEVAASCQNGVYMELFNLEVLAKEKRFIDPKNPFLTCSKRNIAKEQCYLLVPTYLSQTLGMDFTSMFKECEKATPHYMSSCIHGIGSEAIKRNMNDSNSVFALCRKAGSSRHQEMCVVGVVSMYMQQEGSYSAGTRLCENAPQYYRDTCERAVSSSYAFFR